MLLGFLDLLGVLLIGLVAVISINGIQSLTPGARITEVVNFLGLSEFNFQTQVAVIGSIAAFFDNQNDSIYVVYKRNTFLSESKVSGAFVQFSFKDVSSKFSYHPK